MQKHCYLQQYQMGFKPYYKWITFNTEKLKTGSYKDYDVLNLIINGLPSIQV